MAATASSLRPTVTTHDRKTNVPSEVAKDEPGMAERFQRGLQRALNTPRKPHAPIGKKPKERPASKGRVRKGKKGS